ncbi:MAG TPA: family 20 glycosylhydrolase [Puia sp.]|nr:family 20 glycosylhydrolase [Puia sp.]
MKLHFSFIALSCLVVLSSVAQGVVKGPPLPPLAIRWYYVKNLYGPIQKSVSMLTVTNKSTKPFPASGWKIYFSSNRTVDSSSMEGSLRVRHINGDLFCLEPVEGDGAKVSPLQPGDSLQVRYIVADLSINISDAPVGFYLVWDRHPEKGAVISDYTIGRIHDDQLGLMTPAMEFAHNAGITEIPAAGLPRIFPTPVDYKQNTDSCLLTTYTSILTDPAFKEEAGYLAGALSPILGRRLIVSKGAGAVPGGHAAAIKQKSILLRKVSMEPAAYELSVGKDSLVIRASDAEGVFYGIQSLLTATDPVEWRGVPSDKAMRAGHVPGRASRRGIVLPGMEVRDRPRFAYRGFMLDVARNFRSPRELCRILDLMALYKMNVLHLHFSDDEGWRLEIPSLPELTTVGGKRGHTPETADRQRYATGERQGPAIADESCLPASFGSGPEPGVYPGSGYYTRADFIKILRYARVKHIQVIPELESPGHARAAIKAMDFRYSTYKRQGRYAEAVRYLLRDTLDRSVYEGAQLWKDNVICVALPSVYRFMDKVTGEIAAMYKAAGARLTTIHLGGDEVPAGAWEGSPACRKLLSGDTDGGRKADAADGLKRMDSASAARLRASCWAYFYIRLDSLLKSKGLILSGWEEVASLGNKSFHIHVWDNMIGAGNEDLSYRLANAGYPVILSCVSNNYYDLACNRSFDERGYHWGGFLDMDKPYSFIPYDYYKNSTIDYMGEPVKPGYFSQKEKLTAEGRGHILGIEGLLWGETLFTDDRMEYMLLPRLLGTAERAWAADPQWATTPDSLRALSLYGEAWNLFLNVLGKRELPRLSYWNGGYGYRVPPAGVLSMDGQLRMNCALPGFEIRYTTDGSEPNAGSLRYTGPVEARGRIKIKVFDPAGRGGRVVTIENKKI